MPVIPALTIAFSTCRKPEGGEGHQAAAYREGDLFAAAVRFGESPQDAASRLVNLHPELFVPKPEATE